LLAQLPHALDQLPEFEASLLAILPFDRQFVFDLSQRFSRQDRGDRQFREPVDYCIDVACVSIALFDQRRHAREFRSAPAKAREAGRATSLEQPSAAMSQNSQSPVNKLPPLAKLPQSPAQSVCFLVQRFLRRQIASQLAQSLRDLTGRWLDIAGLKDLGHLAGHGGQLLATAVNVGLRVGKLSLNRVQLARCGQSFSDLSRIE
jgi:hypothetical protein